jgi:hypothetical protein
MHGRTKPRTTAVVTLRPKPSDHTLTVNWAALDAYLQACGIDVSNEGVAAYLGVGYGTIQRLRTGGGRPGGAFISALAKKLPPSVPLQRFVIAGESVVQERAA